MSMPNQVAYSTTSGNLQVSNMNIQNFVDFFHTFLRWFIILLNILI
jgi:hypothetical protein